MGSLLDGGIVGTTLGGIALGIVLVRRRGASRQVASQIVHPAHPQENLERLPKEELYERARKANIVGRSKMRKEGLIKALRATT
jgi:hypothetical protein